MSLSDQDREWVKLIIEKLTFEVLEKVLGQHIKNCPHGKTILMSKMLIIGICIGTGLVSAGSALALARLIFGS